MSRQDVEAFMQQRGCPPLPQHILEWQTPHLAKPPPEEEEDQDLDEEAAEAKQQEARLAVGEGLLGDLALVRTKRELSPSASEDLDEPTTKKQKVSWFSLAEACRSCVASVALIHCQMLITHGTMITGMLALS